MRLFAAFLLLVFACSLPAWGQTSDENAARCEKGDPEMKIAGCTVLIQSGQLPKESLFNAYGHRGYAYYVTGKFDQAIQDFDQAMRLNPSFAPVFSLRGNAFYGKAAYDRAILDFDEAIRLDPSVANDFNNRGNAYYSKATYDRAIQDYDEAIRLNPSFADAFHNRGLAYRGKGDHDGAIRNYDEAIRLNPSFADAFKNRGNAYYAKGNYDRAIQDYDEAIRLKPGVAEIFSYRGRAYTQKGNYDRAIQDYDEAIRLDPSSDTFFNRGRVRFDLGQFAASQSDFAKAAELKPSYAYVALWLYLARSRAGQDAHSELKKNAAQLKLTEWPGRVVDLYLGTVTSGEILSAATDADTKKNREQHCEAYFYLGEDALIKGKRIEAKQLFQKAIDTGVTSFIEYTAAQAELKRLSAIPAKTSH